MCLALVLLIAGVIGFVLTYVFTPEKITPLAIKLANEQLNARFNCEQIDLTFFSTFPYLEAHVNRGSLVSASNRNDTLIYFETSNIAINIRQLLFHQTVGLKKIQLINPSARFIFDRFGKSGWDELVKPSAATDTSSTQTELQVHEINIRELRLDNAQISYEDSSIHTYMQLPALNVILSANKDPQKIALDLLASGKNISLVQDSIVLFKQLNSALHTEMEFIKADKKLLIQKGDLALNQLDFDISGSVQKTGSTHQLAMDLHTQLKVHSLDSLWQMIPASFKPFDEAKIGGNAALEFHTKGVYGDGLLPVSTAQLNIQGGSLSYTDYPGRVNHLDADISAVIDFQHPENTVMHVKQLSADGTGFAIDTRINAERVLLDPTIKGRIKATIDLTKMNAMFPLPDGLEMRGTANADIELNTHFKRKTGLDYNATSVNGLLNLKQFDFHTADSSILLKTGYTKLNATGKGVNQVKATLDTDTIHLIYDSIHQLAVRELHLRLDKDRLRKKGFPIIAKTTVEQLSYSGADSLTANLSNAAIDLYLRPNEDFSASEVRTSLTTRSVLVTKSKSTTGDTGYLNQHNHHLRASQLQANFTQFQGRQSTRRVTGHVKLAALQYRSSDSVRARLRQANITATAFSKPGDAAPRIKTKFNAAAVSMRTLKEAFAVRDGEYDLEFEKDSVRDWWPNGSVQFAQLTAVVSALTMPITISNSKIEVADHSASLNHAHVQLGHSLMDVTGKIDNLYPPPGTDTVLRAHLSVDADLIDANELMQASHPTTVPVEKLDTLEDIEAIAVTDTFTTEKSVFELPKHIDLEFKLAVNKLLFGQLTLTDIDGKLEMKKGKLILPALRFHSDEATVEAQLEYEAVNKKAARINYSLKVNDLRLDHLKDLAPSLDTLFPLAKQMDGKAKLQIRGVATLNEHLEPDMKSVRSIAVLEAHHIKVGESEAFRELAKTFMFRNKEKTEIDSLNVEMLINDNKLEILPALVEVDRYRLAVGGIQNIDMSFNYHVSVLKSQIPFKAGVDIKGTFPGYNINLTKAKYKYFFSDKERHQDKADEDILKKRKFILDRLKFQ